MKPENDGFGGQQSVRYQKTERVFGTGEKGGRLKKKKKENLEGQLKNSELSLAESGIQEDQKVGISDTFERVFDADEGMDKLPNLYKYVNWVYEVMTTGDLKDISQKSETKVEVVRRSKGAGGQNVQKNGSFVIVTHKYTGMSVAIGAERSMEQNKKNMLVKMDSLVKAHLMEWKDLLGDEKEKYGDEIAMILKSGLGDKFREGITTDAKSEYFDWILLVLRKKKEKLIKIPR